MHKSTACDNPNSATHAQGRAGLMLAVRRCFEVVCAAIGLLVLSPLLLLICLAVKLQDGGPIFYLQTRVGLDFKPFQLLKFRTMVAHAEGNRHITAANDERITTIGRFLRKYKLDELPQLINVLLGDMQFIGPRPEVDRYVQMFRNEYLVLLRDRPGITDPASITYRNEQALLKADNVEQQYVNEILPEKLRLSLDYAAHRTLGSDIKIIFSTIFHVSTYEGRTRK